MMGESRLMCADKRKSKASHEKNGPQKPRKKFTVYRVCVHRSAAMIYALIEFHLTGIDFFSNGKY